MSIALMNSFKRQVNHFLDELLVQFPNKTNFAVAKIYINQQPAKELVNMLRKHIYPHADEIRSKNEDFFLKYDVPLFSEETNELKEVWNDLDAENKDVMWRWLNYFVSMLDKLSSSEKTALKQVDYAAT